MSCRSEPLRVWAAPAARPEPGPRPPDRGPGGPAAAPGVTPGCWARGHPGRLDTATGGYEIHMRALTTVPLQAGTLEVTEVPDPTPATGELLVDGLAVGVCGTDREIAAGEYGWAPPGETGWCSGTSRSAGCVEAPAGSGFAAGDLVVGIVRRPDPVPCGACAHGEFDMCRNGRYTERGIKELDGYAQRAVDRRGRLRRASWTRARGRRRADGADHGGGQGVGADRADRGAGLVRAAAGAGHRRRARSACWRRCSACSAGSTCTCSTGSTEGPEAAAGRTAWARRTTRRYRTSPRGRAGRRHRGDRRAAPGGRRAVGHRRPTASRA